MHRHVRMLASLVVFVLAAGVAHAEPFGNPAFERVWSRADRPVQGGTAARSWLWGPEAFSPPLNEPYSQTPGGRRAVQYFDKSRMEINDPTANANGPWYVTNGLLVNEMVQGQVQLGNADFIPLPPAAIPVAGDPDNAFPTYADLARVYNQPGNRPLGSRVTASLTREGFGEVAQYINDPEVEIVHMERSFGIPRAFWNFMNQRGTVYENGQNRQNQIVFDWLFAMGYPTTEAYWTRVRVGGVERDVLVQAFERRVLTYTPANPAAFRVEMGNVGRHYYQWRYVAPFPGQTTTVITVPAQNVTEVRSPLRVAGFENGTAFEAAIGVRLRNASTGELIVQAFTTVARPDIQFAGPFVVDLSFQVTQDTPAKLEVFTDSARDGSDILLASRDVVLKP